MRWPHLTRRDLQPKAKAENTDVTDGFMEGDRQTKNEGAERGTWSWRAKSEEKKQGAGTGGENEVERARGVRQHKDQLR